MHVLAMEVELRLRDIHSLKAKRSVIRPIIDGARRRFEVASAEVDHADAWERSALAFATVSGSAAQASQVIDAVERFVWSFPEVEVTSTHRGWVEEG
jgi:uncharacterized protein YlxP (DUF503 family)